MESAIVRELRPEFEPVAVVWSDAIPEEAVQFKAGKFGCILYLFGQAARRGKIAGGDRETIVCSGGRSALGLGSSFDASAEELDTYAAVFSKGLKSARDQESYRVRMEATRSSWRHMYEYGERRHCSPELAEEWIKSGRPRYDIPQRYVLFKPLRSTDPEENVRAVVFTVNPLELAGLTTLAASVMTGTDSVQVAPGPDCHRIACYAYAQADAAAPRAVLGMLDVDGRELMRRQFRDDCLTLTLPLPLFQRMEEEAPDCIFQTPAWKDLTDERG
ncbi:MAG: DUF169 domain-containing protein [Planctomycetota bacterium]|jgi:hypothetical protein